MPTRLDHLVVAADTLQQGITHVEALKQRPQLLHWVVNTTDIEATRSRCIETPNGPKIL